MKRKRKKLNAHCLQIRFDAPISSKLIIKPKGSKPHQWCILHSMINPNIVLNIRGTRGALADFIILKKDFDISVKGDFDEIEIKRKIKL